MLDYFELSIHERILFALAVLNKFSSPEDVAECIDEAVEYFGTEKDAAEKEEIKREVSTLKNNMSKMSKITYGKQREGFLLETKRDPRKILYKIGKFTVDTRLSALMLLLLWETYEARDKVLSYEDALKIAENTGELILNSIKDDDAKESISKIISRISEENVTQWALDLKFDYIVKADYFRRDKARNLEPTQRLTYKEEHYVKALAYLLSDFRKNRKSVGQAN